MDLKRGIDAAVTLKLLKDLKESAKISIKPARKKLHRLVQFLPTTIWSIGELIADAMMKVGTDGVITVEEAKGTETTVWMLLKVCSSIEVTSHHTS
jgi:chaperonin GroEL